jgi:3-hydroxyisobutyrate dehydrogenase
MPGEEEVAFLGLGAMGFGMATNLVKSGFSVTGFDVYAPTLQRFVAAGGKASTTPREAVRGARYVVFMVATAAQILSALFDEGTGAVWDLPRGAIVVLCSTGPPEHAPNVRRLLDERYGRADVELVDAPVSGGTIRAAAGTLTILAAGPDGAVQAARPVLDAMAGEKLYLIPGGLGAGTKVKMVHQVLAGVHITMTSEAMGFAAALGLNTRQAFEHLKASEADSWMFDNRVPHMLDRDPTIYSALNIITKDIVSLLPSHTRFIELTFAQGIVTAGARAEKFPLFLASATEQVLAAGVSAGIGLEDDANLTKVYLPKRPDLVFEQASEAATTTADDPKLKLVAQAMAGVHLAAAAEAMTLGAKVGLDTTQLQEIIATAAGTSWMFVDRAPQMLSGEWQLKKTIEEVIRELVRLFSPLGNVPGARPERSNGADLTFADGVYRRG